MLIHFQHVCCIPLVALKLGGVSGVGDRPRLCAEKVKEAWHRHELQNQSHTRKQQNTNHAATRQSADNTASCALQLTYHTSTGPPPLRTHKTQRISTVICTQPTVDRGPGDVTVTAHQPDYTCPSEQFKHQTSTPQHVRRAGVTQNTSQRRVWYKRRMKKAPSHTERAPQPQIAGWGGRGLRATLSVDPSHQRGSLDRERRGKL